MLVRVLHCSTGSHGGMHWASSEGKEARSGCIWLGTHLVGCQTNVERSDADKNLTR